MPLHKTTHLPGCFQKTMSLHHHPQHLNLNSLLLQRQQYRTEPRWIVGFKDKRNWNDVRANKQEKAAQLMEQRLKEGGSHIDKQNARIESRLHENGAN